MISDSLGSVGWSQMAGSSAESPPWGTGVVWPAASGVTTNGAASPAARLRVKARVSERTGAMAGGVMGGDFNRARSVGHGGMRSHPGLREGRYGDLCSAPAWVGGTLDLSRDLDDTSPPQNTGLFAPAD